MTLNDLIKKSVKLSSVDITLLTNPHSYRGYHDQLAFEIDYRQKMTGFDLMGQCVNLLDTELKGYKGGSYIIGHDTEVWIAKPGHMGQRLLEIESDGTIILDDID